MIDHETEGLIPITTAAKHFPTRPSTATVWRWTLRGSRGRKLETLLIGGRRYTSRDAIDRFIRGDAEPPAATAAKSRTTRQRQAAIAAAEKELSAAGI